MKYFYSILSLGLFLLPTFSHAATCSVNGEMVECPQFINFIADLGFFVFFPYIIFAIIILTIVSTWKMLTKAGQPGWSCLIPIYNAIVYLRVAGKPEWWIFLYFIPVVNFVVIVITMNEIAKAFGKGVGFTAGMFFLPFIFVPILAFSKAQYNSPIKVS